MKTAYIAFRLWLLLFGPFVCLLTPLPPPTQENQPKPVPKIPFSMSNYGPVIQDGKHVQFVGNPGGWSAVGEFRHDGKLFLEWNLGGCKAIGVYRWLPTSCEFTGSWGWCHETAVNSEGELQGVVSESCIVGASE